MPSPPTSGVEAAAVFAIAVTVAIGMAASVLPDLPPWRRPAGSRRGVHARQRLGLAWRRGLWPWRRPRVTPAGAPVLKHRSAPGKAVDAMAEALEGVLVTVIAHLQAGRPLRQAWLEAAREVPAPALEPAKGAFIAALGAGLSLEEALGSWYAHSGLRALRRCQAVAAAHRRTGGDATGPLLAVVHGLREQRLAWADMAARTAEARLSAQLLAILPVVVMAYALALDPAFLRPLWDDPIGRWGLGYAIASWLTGIHLLRRLAGSLAREVEGSP